MCTRKQAIFRVVEKRQGTISEIKKLIGGFYDPFVIMGIISERVPAHNDTVVSKSKKRVEWEATELAEEKARIFELIPD